MTPDWTPLPLDFLIGFEPGMELPKVTNDWRSKQWNPSDYSIARRTTEESHWFWMFRNRQQLRWRHMNNRIVRVELTRAQLATGMKLARRLIERGIADMSDVNDSDKARAELAMGYAAGLLTDEGADIKTRDRLAAASLILTFCRAKPAQKAEVTISRAEDFLAAVEDDDDA